MIPPLMQVEATCRRNSSLTTTVRAKNAEDKDSSQFLGIIKGVGTIWNTIGTIKKVLKDPQELKQLLMSKIEVFFMELGACLELYPEKWLFSYDSSLQSNLYIEKKTCDQQLRELEQHIVLIHAISPNCIYNLESFDYKNLDKDYTEYLIPLILTKEGIIGRHLDLKNQQFRGKLIDRPHLHWAWNQLVQRNSGGEWESSSIAILEPLHAFEKSTIYGLAPYDTLTMGPHRLSKDSTLLIPELSTRAIQEYFARTNFQGSIISYPQKVSLRKAVFDTLCERYPNTWHLIDPKSSRRIGAETHTAREDFHQRGGYLEETWVETAEKKKIILITRAGETDVEVHEPGLREAKNNGKFIGLHIHSAMYCLEDDNQRSFKKLKQFRENKRSIENDPCFVAYAKNFQNLLILEIIRFYKHCVDKEELREVADYLLYEAFFADIVSIFYASGREFDLTFHDLDLLISSLKGKLLWLLDHSNDNIGENPTPHPNWEKTVLKVYSSVLIKGIASIQAAKQFEKLPVDDTSSFSDTTLDKIFSKLTTEVEKDWTKVCSEGRLEDSDFEKKWPLTGSERDFIKKIRLLIPNIIGTSVENKSTSLKIIVKRLLMKIDHLITNSTSSEKRRELLYIKYGITLFFKEILFIMIIKSQDIFMSPPIFDTLKTICI